MIPKFISESKRLILVVTLKLQKNFVLSVYIGDNIDIKQNYKLK
jgi:hypothetical protein